MCEISPFELPEICIIIPVHNEETSILTVAARIGDRYPYFIVDDRSDDGTVRVCESAGLRCFCSDEPRGKQGAVRCGIRRALEDGFRYAVILDGDGQHDPSFIPHMIEILRAGGADIVIGSRFVSERKPFTRRMIGSRIISSVIRRKTGLRIADPTSGMHAYAGAVMEDIAGSGLHFAEPDLLVDEHLKGRKIAETQVRMNERSSGESAYGTAWAAVVYMYRVLAGIRKAGNARKPGRESFTEGAGQ